MREILVATITPLHSRVSIEFVKSFFEVRDYAFIIQAGTVIYENRNKVWQKARELNKPVLFVDSDMVFTRKDVETLERHILDGKDIVCGVCVLSEDGHPPAVFKEVKDGFTPTEIQDKLFEVDACGAAFVAISAKVVQALENPFYPLDNPEDGLRYGEDISFCIRAKKAGFKILCDPKVQIGHIKPKTLYYAEPQK